MRATSADDSEPRGETHSRAESSADQDEPINDGATAKPKANRDPNPNHKTRARETPPAPTLYVSPLHPTLPNPPHHTKPH